MQNVSIADDLIIACIYMMMRKATEIITHFMVFSLYFNFKTAQRLGEQCFYDVSCSYNDENSACLQINHNAICECKEGFHMVTHLKPTRRTFCTQGESHKWEYFKGLCVITYLDDDNNNFEWRNFAVQ